MIDFKKFIRHLSEEKCINITDFKTPFVVVSEDLSEVFKKTHMKETKKLSPVT